MISEATTKIINTLARQSGMGVIFAIVCGYAVIQVYSDLRERNSILVELIRLQVAESRAVTDSLKSLSSRLERIEYQEGRKENR